MSECEYFFYREIGDLCYIIILIIIISSKFSLLIIIQIYLLLLPVSVCLSILSENDIIECLNSDHEYENE